MTGLVESPSRKPVETNTAIVSQTAPSDPALQWRGALKSLQRGERKSLLASQASGYALLRSAARGAAAKAAAMAQAEIALAFAHRWAEIRRLPAALRAAAV